MLFFNQKKREWSRKGKLQVIEGRKAVRPGMLGSAGRRKI